MIENLVKYPTGRMIVHIIAALKGRKIRNVKMLSAAFVRYISGKG